MKYDDLGMPRPIRIFPKRPVRVYIRERRELAGLTQQQLAQRLNTSSGTVSRWESTTAKRRVPTVDVLGAIAEALGIDVELLFRSPDQADVFTIGMDEPTKTLADIVAIIDAARARRRAKS